MFGYIFGFWAFLFSPKYRANTLHTWRDAGWAMRSMMILEAVVATLVGLGLPLLIIWLLA